MIREQVPASFSDHGLNSIDASHKLQVILEIGQHLGRTLDMEELLGKLLDHLMRLFPHGDRAMVLLCEGERMRVPGAGRATARKIVRFRTVAPLSATLSITASACSATTFSRMPASRPARPSRPSMPIRCFACR